MVRLRSRGGLLGFFSLMVAPATAQEGGSTGEAAGIVFQTLPEQDLDAIKEATGYRVGVSVAEVRGGSAGAAAGVKAGDIIIIIGTTGVDSAEAAVAAIEAASGVVEVMAFTRSEEGYEGTTYSLDLSGEVPGEPVPSEPTGVEGDLGAAVTAYFDMMDFIRTQAWGKPVSTSDAERERVAGLLQEAMGEMDEETQAAIQKIPEVWAAVQKAWGEASEGKKTEQREYWRKQLLLPNQLIPPPEEHETFRSEGDTVAFDYPPGWVVAQTQDEDMQYLYLGPPDTQASWSQVIDPSASPPGALFVTGTATKEMQATDTFLAEARLIAQQFVNGNAPDMKEIGALDLGNAGAIITLLGHYPGQREEKFYWVGVAPFGAGNFFGGRLGGPSAQAETLIPAFDNMIATLDLKPPGVGGGEGGEYGSAMVDYYAAKAGNIATSGPW